ncbi:MAG: hypothetical protein ACREE4_05405 [Stellaceae bacterium]|jgi:hypothetical protein
MAQDHGDIFKDSDLNLDRFKPRAAPAADRPTPQDLRGIAERTKFISREPKEAGTPPVPLLRRGNRRTGRTVTVTLKTTPDHSNRFYAIAEARDWLVGETFEHALQALEEKLARLGEGT